MSREEAREFIKTKFGIEEPTDQQVTDFLNETNKDSQKKNDLTTKYNDEKKRADDLQKQLDELNDSKLTDAEKAQKELEAQTSKVASLEKQIQLMERKTKLAEKGIVGEEAEKLFNADGSLDFDAFGAILADREAKAKAEKEKELLDRTPDAGNKGGKGGEDDGKPDALTQSVINGLKKDNKVSANIINNYVQKGKRL